MPIIKPHSVLRPVQVTLCLSLTAFWLSALAQTPATAPRTATLGGGTGNPSARVLTRDELRLCITQRATLDGRIKEIDAQQREIESGKSQLLKDSQEIRAENDAIRAGQGRVAELNARTLSFNARSASLRERINEANDPKSTRKLTAAEREALQRESDELRVEGQTLEAERVSLRVLQERVEALRARAALHDPKVDDWNQRNARSNETLKTLQLDRDVWATDCADRRYREDDETAIRRGQ